jgi:hypothetical protein
MLNGAINKRVTKVYGPETWIKARELYQGGKSLEAVGKELEIPYPTVRYHAWIEEWGVRVKGIKRDPRREAAKARDLAKKLAREETLMVREASLAKAEELEVLARKSLVTESARAKVLISRRVTEILSRLEDPSVPPRSAAQALGSLVPVLRLVYGWDKEPNLDALESAALLGGCRDAINLALIRTTPEQVRRLTTDGNHKEIPLPAASDPSAGKAPPGDPYRGGPHPQEKEKRGPAVEQSERGPRPVREQHEDRQAVGDGPQSPKKESPTFPACEARPEVDQDPSVPSPTPGSPEWNRQRLDRLAKEQAQWRRDRWRAG